MPRYSSCGRMAPPSCAWSGGRRTVSGRPPARLPLRGLTPSAQARAGGETMGTAAGPLAPAPFR
eukprot:418281-Alexandrium_andersonii.AAC.1